MKQMFGLSKTDRFISVHTLQVCNPFGDLCSIIISQLWWHRMLSRLYRSSYSLPSGVVNVKIKATKPNEQPTHTHTHTITPGFTCFTLLHFSGSWSEISLAYLVHSIPCYAFCHCTLTFHQVIISSKQPKTSRAITLLMTTWQASDRTRKPEEGSHLTTIRAITM